MKALKILLAFVLVVSAPSMVLLGDGADNPVEIGPITNAQAQTMGTYEFHNQTYTIDDSTEGLYVDAMNYTGTDLDVQIFTIDSNGNESMVKQHAMTPNQTSKTEFEYLDLDPANYTEYRILVLGDENESLEFLEAGILPRTSDDDGDLSTDDGFQGSTNDDGYIAPDNSGTFYDKTFDVDNDTEAVYVDAKNYSGDWLDVTIYGVDSGAEEQVDSTQILADDPDTIDSYRYESIDPDTYDSYRVLIEGDSNHTVEYLDAGLVVKDSGSGGGGLLTGGDGPFGLTDGGIVVVLIVVIGGFLMFME